MKVSVMSKVTAPTYLTELPIRYTSDILETCRLWWKRNQKKKKIHRGSMR